MTTTNRRPATRKKKTGLSEIGFEENEQQHAQTFEFDDIRATIDKFQRHNRYSYEDPYVKSENKEQRQEEERRRQQEYEAKRRERQRTTGLKLNNPQTINDLESEPAYMRRGIQLDDVPHSGDLAMSKWTISDEDEPELREGNSFLHDNVD